MKKSLMLLQNGFESSCYATPEFKNFVKVFKSEFKKELKDINATNIVFSVGHFYISGFFTVESLNEKYYFSISDVRSGNIKSILLRTAKDYKDFTGGRNTYVSLKNGMFKDCLMPAS